MKVLFFSLSVILFLSGCSQDIKSLSKSECSKLGYKFVVKKRLNYRTGKYESYTMCLNNRS